MKHNQSTHTVFFSALLYLIFLFAGTVTTAKTCQKTSSLLGQNKLERTSYEVNGTVFIRNENKRGAKQKEATESVVVLAYEVERDSLGNINRLVFRDSKLSQITNAKGAFTFSLFGDTEYSIRCIKEGFTSEPIIFGKKKVATGERISIEIELFQGKNTVLEGICLSEEGKLPISDTQIFLEESKTGITMELWSDESGSFRFPVDEGKSYVLSVKNRNFFTQQPKTIKALPNAEPLTETVWLREIVVGQAMTIETPSFYLNDYHLTKEGMDAIEQIYPILFDNPNVHFELGVHTDARGNDEYNLALTQKRAEEIVAHLIEKGIAPSKVSGKGYGEQKIRNHCQNGVRCSNNGHLVNRRMELKVLGFVE